MGEDEARRWLPKTGTVLRVLTFTQNCSALVFSGFLTVHLVSPLAASIGGTSWADRSLLIGREYYLPSEDLTIYLPLAIHFASSSLKRLYLTSKSSKFNRPTPTTHHLTGWILPFFLLPHILSHRLIPSSPDPPISALSPSELNYEFVGYNLNSRPFWSGISYLTLIGVGTYHAGVGMMKVTSWIKRLRGGESSPTSITTTTTTERSAKSSIDDSIPTLNEKIAGLEGPVVEGVKQEEENAVKEELQPKRKISKRRKLGLRSILLVYLGIIGIGLVRVAREHRHISRVMAIRYDAVNARFWP